MPMYSYLSKDGNEITKICSYEERPEMIETNGVVYYLVRVNKISRNTEENLFGVNGKFDKNLQARYSNYKERDAICEKKGVAPISKTEISNAMDKADSKNKEMQKQANAHRKAVEAQKQGKSSYVRAYDHHYKQGK